jgi:hypothetical protein
VSRRQTSRNKSLACLLRQSRWVLPIGRNQLALEDGDGPITIRTTTVAVLRTSLSRRRNLVVPLQLVGSDFDFCSF